MGQSIGLKTLKHALFVTSQNDVISIIRKQISETSSQKIETSVDINFGSLTLLKGFVILNLKPASNL